MTYILLIIEHKVDISPENCTSLQYFPLHILQQYRVGCLVINRNF